MKTKTILFILGTLICIIIFNQGKRYFRKKAVEDKIRYEILNEEIDRTIMQYKIDSANNADFMEMYFSDSAANLTDSVSKN